MSQEDILRFLRVNSETEFSPSQLLIYLKGMNKQTLYSCLKKLRVKKLVEWRLTGREENEDNKDRYWFKHKPVVTK